MREYVLIGSGIAALSAAEAIRRVDRQGRITLLSSDPEPFYSRPGLAYLLTGAVPERQLQIRTPAEVKALGLERVTGTATRLRPAEHRVHLASGDELRFDRLLLAPGARSIPAGFPGAELDGVVQLDGLGDARRIVQASRRGRTAVVVGGGSTALELVEGFHARRMKTHYLLRGERYWPRVLDPAESALVESGLAGAGIRLHRRTEVLRAVGKGGRLSGVETSAGTIACDLLAVATGVEPRTELARAAGLAVDRGILADEYLATSAPDIYVAGDAAQVHDPAVGRAVLDTLWSTAQAQGHAAGLNLAGSREVYRKDVARNVTCLAGVVTAVIGDVGGSEDADLVGLTRGQSEAWWGGPAAVSVVQAHAADRIRIRLAADRIVGAVVMGNQDLAEPLIQLIRHRVNIAPIRDQLVRFPESWMRLIREYQRHWHTTSTREPHVHALVAG